MKKKKVSRFGPNEKIVDGKLMITESCVIENTLSSDLVAEIKKEFSEAATTGQRMVLKPRIEAIHAGRTKNNNIYLAEKLMGARENHTGVHSFTYPYPKPMIINHDTESIPNGRITSAQYVTDSVSGKDAIVIVPEVTDPEAINRLLDGRYLTVSVGSSTNAAICNICGIDQMDDWCEHRKGETYGDTVCGWILGDLTFNECSFVSVPADEHAMVVSLGTPVAMESFVVGQEVVEFSTKGRIVIEESLASTLGLKTEETEDPETPEIPEIPEVPETPEVPDVPELPETPEVPEAPDVPEAPEVPEVPEIPEVPETPEVPEVPEVPNESVKITAEQLVALEAFAANIVNNKENLKELERVKESLKVAKEDIMSLESENEELLSQQESSIITFNKERISLIVDLKEFLGEDTETIASKLEGASSEAILADLRGAIEALKEKANKPITYVTENPGKNIHGEEENVKTLTPADVIKNLLVPKNK